MLRIQLAHVVGGKLAPFTNPLLLGLVPLDIMLAHAFFSSLSVAQNPISYLTPIRYRWMVSILAGVMSSLDALCRRRLGRPVWRGIALLRGIAL